MFSTREVNSKLPVSGQVQQDLIDSMVSKIDYIFFLRQNQQQSGIIIQIYYGVIVIAYICDNMKKWPRAHLALSGRWKKQS